MTPVQFSQPQPLPSNREIRENQDREIRDDESHLSFPGPGCPGHGASSGIGLAAVKTFAQAGAAVVLADINEDALRAATAELTSAGHQAIGVTCDVADEAQVAAMPERTVAVYGRLDMAFTGRTGGPGHVSRNQAWSDRSDQERCDRLRATWHPHQCGVPGRCRYAHVLRHD